VILWLCVFVVGCCWLLLVMWPHSPRRPSLRVWLWRTFRGFIRRIPRCGSSRPYRCFRLNIGMYSCTYLKQPACLPASGRVLAACAGAAWRNFVPMPRA
jgi:hypothetical protein